MPTFTYPWSPERLQGSYLTLKNIETGQRKKILIDASQLRQVKKDLERFRILRDGLPYPWTPTKLEGNYLYYHNPQSDEDTKVYIPDAMLSWIETTTTINKLPQKKKISLERKTPQEKKAIRKREREIKRLQISSPSDRNKIVFLVPSEKKYIERGNFAMLKERMTAEERLQSQWATHPFTKRFGIVEQVLSGNMVLVSGVAVKIRSTETPHVRDDPMGWKASRDALEALTLGKEVELRINLDNPEDTDGTTLADIYLPGMVNVSDVLQERGLAPIPLTPELTTINKVNEWLWKWNIFEKLGSWEYAKGATIHNYAVQQSFGHWGTAGILDRYSISDTTTLNRIYRKLVLGEGAIIPQLSSDTERVEGEFLDKLATDLLFSFGDPALRAVSGESGVLRKTATKSGIKRAVVRVLNSVEAPELLGYETNAMRVKRAFRQLWTLPFPQYYAVNIMGDTSNMALMGTRNPIRLYQADRILKMPTTVSLGNRAAIITKSGSISQNELIADATKAGWLRNDWYGDTMRRFGRKDWLDKGMSPMQNAAGWWNARSRMAVYIDRLIKGDTKADAMRAAKRNLIDYNSRTLTNFEQRFLYPNIPFYMFTRQQALIYSRQFLVQPYTFTTLAQFVNAFGPTTEEKKGLRDYQQNYILIRNPRNPKQFYRVRLPIEDIALLYNRLSSPEKLLSLGYPWISAPVELLADRNFFDQTKPSQDYAKYAAKKFGGAYYYRTRDIYTTPDPNDIFIKQILGIGIVEPKMETDVGSSLVEAGQLKGYDQIHADAIKKKVVNQLQHRINFEKFVDAQSALAPSERERPETWGVLDYVFSPLTAGMYAMGAAGKNRVTTGSYFQGNYGIKDKISPSDVGTLFRAMRHTREWLYLKMGYSPSEIYDPNNPIMPVIQWMNRNEGGFVDDLLTDILTDPNPISKMVKGGGVVFKYANKQLKLTKEGVAYYNFLVLQHGEKEAPHIFARALKSDPELIRTAFYPMGWRFAYTDYEIINNKYADVFLNPAGVVLSKIATVGGGAISRSADVIGRTLSDKLKNPLRRNKPVEYSDYSYLIKQWKREIEAEYNVLNDDISTLSRDSRRQLGRGYQRVVTELGEDESKRAWYPQLKPILDKIGEHNRRIAALEKVVDLLERERINYLMHAMTPEAQKAYKAGKLKTPAFEIMVEGRKIARPGIKYFIDDVLNPYNYQRHHEMTIIEMNDWSMKENGFPMFMEAFDSMRYRAKLHATGMTVKNALWKINEDFGEPLGYKGKVKNGYATSTIPELEDKQYPEDLLKALIKDPLIIEQYPPPPSLKKWTREQVLSGRGALWLYDVSNMLWRLSMTVIKPDWYTGNAQSAILYNAVKGEVWDPRQYYKAQKLRWNLWKGAYVPEELAIESPFITKQYSHAKIQELLADPERQKLLFGQTGMAQDLMPKAGEQDAVRDLKLIVGFFSRQEQGIERFTLWYDKIEKGAPVEMADDAVKQIHFDYDRKSMSWVHREILARVMKFSVWQLRNPPLIASMMYQNPAAFALMPKIMNAWNGDKGEIERSYLNEWALNKLIFRLPGTQDSYVAPAIFSGINMALSIPGLFAQTQFNFYWDEAKKDPYLLERFAREQLGEQVGWLKRGGGVGKVVGNDIVITYKETGESITASLGTDKLVFTNTDYNIVLKEFPTTNINGKIGINNDARPLERIAAWFVTPILYAGVEFFYGHNLMFGAPIEDTNNWLLDTFLPKNYREEKGIRDPTVDTTEKIHKYIIGNMIYHAASGWHEPEIKEQAKEVVDEIIWKQLNADYLGCD